MKTRNLFIFFLFFILLISSCKKNNPGVITPVSEKVVTFNFKTFKHFSFSIYNIDVILKKHWDFVDYPKSGSDDSLIEIKNFGIGYVSERYLRTDSLASNTFNPNYSLDNKY